MKISIISCLFMLLLLAIAAPTRNSPPQTATTTSRIPPHRQGVVGHALFSSPQSMPAEMRDHLRRWLNPTPAPRVDGAFKSEAWRKYHTSALPRLSGEVREAWVRHYASGLAASRDEVTASTIDAAGNVYVTGYGANLTFQPDYLTIKYDASGNQIWIARYNGDGDGVDVAAAIAVDAAGNVYVTGSSESSSANFDCATIKYNAAGVEQWVTRYNGSGNGDDFASDLAVDGAGNIYVTGTSAGAGTATDYVTIKYDASGAEQWVARYNGSANARDGASDLAVDGSGNVYVTGTSAGAGTGSDYATIKYNASGAQQWAARYNGPSNSERQIDAAVALAVDGAGNVYVTGTSEGTGTLEDYTTIQYNAAGAEQWVARYNGPGDFDVAIAIAIDDFGNVYVTGVSDSVAFNPDYATVKYNAAGKQQWVARYNGPANDAEETTAIAVDRVGNVYVTGTSFGAGTDRDQATIKYNSSGVQQWAIRYNGQENKDDFATALTADAAGNIYVAGTTEGADSFADYVAFKYDSMGVEQWRTRYNSLGNANDEATAIAVDVAGNVYVTGRSMRSGTSFDYLTIKSDAAGNTQWMARYDGPGNGWDEPAAIAVDDAGNVYVTGRSIGSGTGYDYATIKYSATGTELWIARYHSLGNADDYAMALTVDPAVSGTNVYVTGWSEGSGTGRDYVTIKYNGAGAPQWVSRYNGSGNADDQATAIKADAAGNVYVTGSSMGAGAAFDYATIKYNNVGEARWIVRYNGSGNDDDLATALAIDGSGNVYVTGSSVGAGTFSDYATIKYDPMGAEQWVMRYHDPERPFNMAIALAVDGAGNVHVAGTSWGAGAAFDYVTVKYNTSGDRQWTAVYDGPANDADHAAALALDDSGNVYVAGWSVGAGTFSDYATVKYNAAGTQQWLARYNRSGASLDYATAMVVDRAANGSNVYVTGSSSGEHWSMYTTIKYAPATVAVKDKTIVQPGSYRLSQNYPNPVGNGVNFLAAKASTAIRYALPTAGYVTLKVFNLLGEEVATLVSDQKPAGEHEIFWRPADLPGGVYCYRIQVDDPATGPGEDYVETRKLILLR